MVCQYPWTPEGSRLRPPYRERADSVKGNDIHGLGQRIVEGDERRDDISKETLAYEASLRDYFAILPAHSAIYSELPVAWSFKNGTARILPSKGRRDYTAKKWHEFAGTLDIVLVSVDGRTARVDDFKTGFGARAHDAADSWQLKQLALAVARIYGCDEVDCGLVHLDVDGHYRDGFLLDSFDLFDIEDALRGLAAKIEKGDAAPVAGPHCWDSFCDIRAVCPVTLANEKRALEVAGAQAVEFGDGFKFTSNEQARAGRIALKVWQPRAELIEDALKEYARRQPVDMGDGVFYGMKEETSKRDSIDLTDPRAVAIIRSEVGEDAFELKATKASIMRAVTAKCGSKGATAKVRAIVERLREVGAIEERPYERFTEFKKDSNDDEGEAA